MDDFRLRVFIAAAQTRSFTKAAEQLCISQPAVSKHISELESRYKVPLFVRSGGRLTLTAAGEVMLELTEHIINDYRRLQYEMGLCTRHIEGELRLGASTTIAQYLLPAILARFTSRFPEVRVSLLSGNSGQIEEALEKHTIDLGMVESISRKQGLHYTHFADDELVLIAGMQGVHARTETISCDQLKQTPLVLREDGSGTLEVIAGALAANGIKLSALPVVMRLASTEGIKSFVRNSDAMAIVSVISVVEELRNGTLRIIDLEGLSLGREFAFASPTGETNPLAQQFAEFTRSQL